MTNELREIIEEMEGLSMRKEKIERIYNNYKAEGFSKTRIKNRLIKENNIDKAQKEQKRVKTVVVTINWKKSSAYGFCPNLSARVEYLDDTCKYLEGYKASGWGYDKASTVLANLLNDTIRYKLWELQDKHTEEYLNNKAPYGISFNRTYAPYFAGGVGVNCYYNIIKYLGGKMEQIVDNKTTDVYRITF